MAFFEYIAKTKAGETSSGEMEAKDRKSVADSLRSRGLYPVSIKEKEILSTGSLKFSFFSKISLKDRMMFTRHLSVMLSSGLSLPKALSVIADQTRSKKFKLILSDMEKEVKMGKSFGDVLEKEQIFDELSVNMIRVGEVSGKVSEVLRLLADQLEKENSLRNKVRGAMYYPAVILIVMIGIGIAAMTYIVPKMTGIFTEMEVDLPWSTQLIMDVGNFMANHQSIVFGSFAITIIAVIIFLRTKPGKKTLSYVAIHTPVIKNIVIKLNNARFARIYSSLIVSGVPVVESLKIISNTLTNPFFKEAFSDIKNEVQKGKPLNGEMARYPKLFPVIICQMIKVGEETGKTADVLEEIAGFYEEEIDQLTKNLSSIIEPVLMVVIGCAVGFFAISMLTPMYSILDKM